MRPLSAPRTGLVRLLPRTTSVSPLTASQARSVVSLASTVVQCPVPASGTLHDGLGKHARPSQRTAHPSAPRHQAALFRTSTSASTTTTPAPAKPAAAATVGARPFRTPAPSKTPRPTRSAAPTMQASSVPLPQDPGALAPRAAAGAGEPVPPSEALFPSSGKFDNELVGARTEVAVPAATSAVEVGAGSGNGNGNGGGGGAEEGAGTPTPTPMSSEDLSVSYRGAAQEPFPRHIIDILLEPIPEKDIEIKPDGMIYLPEIKYRRVLNRAFGPGGWGLVPRGPHTVTNRTISREYALFCLGRFVSQARGEQDYFSEDGLPTATEGCKSNALMRCCKDLGIASELWDPAFIREFKGRQCVQVVAVQGSSGARKTLWRRRDRTLEYPYREEGVVGATAGAGAGQAQREGPPKVLPSYTSYGQGPQGGQRK
ncbi:hypothetical protein HDU96_007109 [Phlyctochytrium bullatum]|nr:hypothetical protein HDU96_007109 [Phlyctochytrium bullatum]